MDDKIINTYCTNCRYDTRHSIMYETEDESEFGEYKTIWQVVECMGCLTKSFRKEDHDYWDTYEDEFGETGYNIVVENYPNPLKGHVGLRNNYNLPEKISTVYYQTIMAFKGKSYLLAGAGFRAVIEAICIHEKIRGGNLETKIDRLSKNRLITEKEAERLHSIRFIGNDSIHEMEVPTENKLFLVLEIIETLLKNLYIIDSDTKHVLDTRIKEYTDFEDLLWKCANKSDTTKERTIVEILGKHIRRVNTEIGTIESIIIDRIKTGELKFLKLGSNTSDHSGNHTQFYLYTGLEYDDLPF